MRRTKNRIYFNSIITFSLILILFLFCSYSINNSSDFSKLPISSINPRVVQNNLVPIIPAMNLKEQDFKSDFEDLNKISLPQKTDRKIASNESKEIKNKKSKASSPSGYKENEFNQISNKKLYFITLLNQYERFQMFYDFDNFKITPITNYCPNFHSAYLEFFKNYELNLKGKKNPILTLKMNTNKTENLSIKKYPILSNIKRLKTPFLFPELHLPTQAESIHPTVIDHSQNSSNNEKSIETLKNWWVTAYKIHLQKIRQEISELCDNGSSDNYYAFENLISHMKSHAEFNRSQGAMEALLKISLINNTAILSGLEMDLLTGDLTQAKVGEGPEYFTHTKEFYQSDLMSEVFSRLGTKWVKSYFAKLKDLRQNKLTSRN